MLRSKITSWFFLGYLVLLLNLGPSLHHAPIFGLHGLHHHANSGDSSGHSSCCCHGHTHTKTLIPSLSAEFGADSESSAFASDIGDSAEHSCAFCKFFDEYNVVVSCYDCDPIESPFSLFLAEIPDGASAEFVPNVARGPPTA